MTDNNIWKDSDMKTWLIVVIVLAVLGTGK